MGAAGEAIGTDFGVETRLAALQEWRRRARAAERQGVLARHPIATSVAVGVACGLALALWRSNRARGRRGAPFRRP